MSTPANLYIGLISGTSVDGIDAALVRIGSGQIELVGFLCHKMPSALQSQLQKIISEQSCTLHELTEADYQLGHEMAVAVANLLEQTGIKANEIKAIGSHGQTVYHQPNGEYKTTLQIGSAHVLAAKTGIPVIANFRNMDMALDGQGAPLAPIIHEQIFLNANNNAAQNIQKAESAENIAVLNLGGIANLSLMGKDFPAVIGYDTGPANCLMDSWIQIHKNMPYDANGDWAKTGDLNSELLAQMLSQEPYFHQKHPKSTGRELFNLNWFKNFVDEFKQTNAADIQATLAHLTAKSVALELDKHLDKHNVNFEKIVVMGGGSKNTFLIDLLKKYCKTQVLLAEDFGYNSESIEAILFAYLAYLRDKNITLDLSAITGSYQKLLLGDIVKL